eukprot:sb/3475712/
MLLSLTHRLPKSATSITRRFSTARKTSKVRLDVGIVRFMLWQICYYDQCCTVKLSLIFLAPDSALLSSRGAIYKLNKEVQIQTLTHVSMLLHIIRTDDGTPLELSRALSGARKIKDSQCFLSG